MTALRNVLILTSDKNFEREATACLTGCDCTMKVLKESWDAVLSVLEEDIDVVVLDADGEELKSLVRAVRIIEKCRPRIPVVVATSNYSILSGTEILKEGIFYYLMKPLTPNELGEVVTRAIRKKEYLERI